MTFGEAETRYTHLARANGWLPQYACALNCEAAADRIVDTGYHDAREVAGALRAGPGEQDIILTGTLLEVRP